MIGGALAQQYDKNKASERQRQDDAKKIEQAQDQLAKYSTQMADLIFERQDIDRIKQGMLDIAHKAATTTSPTVSALNIDLEKADRRIAKVMQEIPQEIKDAYGKEKLAEGEEALAQVRAKAANDDIRPRLLATMSVIRDMLHRGSAKGVIQLDKIEDLEPIPAKLMFTRFDFLQSKLSEEDSAKGFKVHFKHARTWQVFIKYGFVKSPDLKAKWFDSPADTYYPMVRIAIEGLDTATIYFHHETKALSVEYGGDRGVRESLIALQNSGKDEDVVAALAIELMKLSRLNGQ